MNDITPSGFNWFETPEQKTERRIAAYRAATGTSLVRPHPGAAARVILLVTAIAAGVLGAVAANSQGAAAWAYLACGAPAVLGWPIGSHLRRRAESRTPTAPASIVMAMSDWSEAKWTFETDDPDGAALKKIEQMDASIVAFAESFHGSEFVRGLSQPGLDPRLDAFFANCAGARVAADSFVAS